MREIILNGAQNTTLYGYVLEPEDKTSVKALMVIIHGLGEHSGRYIEYVQQFARQGVCTYTMDLRGHGKSPGKRGHAAPRRLIIEDVDSLCHYAEKDYPNVPLFIYGHSMGGNIGLYHRLYGKFRPKGYIISSPWIVLYNQLSGFTVASMKILSKFAPKLGIKSSINIKDLSSDQSMIPSEPDPLCHGYISVLTGVECYEGAKEILRNSSIEKEDLLLIHGSADNICSVEGSRLFMKNAPKSCTYVEFEGNYHELHYDKDRDRVAETVKNWVWERL